MATARFPCPACSAGMSYDPELGKLKCPYCGASAEVPQEAKASLREIPYSEYEGAAMGKISEKALEVACGGCGAAVQFEPPEVAGTCPFCAAAIVGQPKAADPLVAPHGILPFQVNPEGAKRALRAWLRGLWFAPNELEKLARTDALQGVYVPFWTFDAGTETDYRGERGEHYWETEVYVATENGRQVERTRQVMRTRWHAAWGHVSVPFDDVLAPATRAIAVDRLSRLDPWGPEAVRPYEPGYLAGFKAQRYQVELPEGYKRAQEIMRGVIHEHCARDIGGDEQRVHSMETSYENVTFKHILLPVWIGAYRFKGRVFQILVNGRTSEVQGERPYSTAKIALAVLIAVLLFLVVVMLANR